MYAHTFFGSAILIKGTFEIPIAIAFGARTSLVSYIPIYWATTDT